MARTLILMVHLWERRQPMSGAQTHMSCTTLLNLSLIVMIQAIPYTMHIAHFSWAPPDCTLWSTRAIKLIEYIPITMGKVDGCRLWSQGVESILTIHARTENLSIYMYLQEGPHPSLIVQEHRLSIICTPDCGSNSTAKQRTKTF